MSRRVALAAAIALTLAPVAAASGQELPPCDYILENTGTTRLNFSRNPAGQTVTFLGQGVAVTCSGQNNRLTSDSAEFYEERGQLLFIGNVKYTEPRATIDAARMVYFLDEARVTAEGSVVARLENGSVMRGPSADYYRAVEGRPVSRLIAIGRPQLSLVQLDSAGRAAEPVIVLADNLLILGDSIVYASRKVDISRSGVQANSDSAFVDGEREFIRLMQSPVVNGKGERPFTLRGGVIDLFSKNRQLERVLASPSAHVTSSDIELLADSIDLRLAGERLQRAFAWGPGRARATSPDRDITADSLDIVMPGQRLQTVTAIGGAYANSIPDTARVVSNERDWMRGDTIIARFDSAAAGDTSRARPRELTASGSARSFYHMGNQEGIRDRPSLNYVRGRLITVAFESGEVSTVTVVDQASGVYLEAEPGALAPLSAQPSVRPVPTPAPPPARPRPGSD